MLKLLSSHKVHSSMGNSHPCRRNQISRSLCHPWLGLSFDHFLFSTQTHSFMGANVTPWQRILPLPSHLFPAVTTVITVLQIPLTQKCQRARAVSALKYPGTHDVLYLGNIQGAIVIPPYIVQILKDKYVLKGVFQLAYSFKFNLPCPAMPKCH